MFRAEHLNEYKIRIEQTRAEANEELSEGLHEVEMADAARFERMARVYEEGRKDPDDVFFAAARRKREIERQIKGLKASYKLSVTSSKGKAR